MKKCSTTEETYTVIEKKGQSINIERESDMQENINFIVAIVTSLITMCTLIFWPVAKPISHLLISCCFINE